MPADFQQGRPWQLSLVNFSGDEADVTIMISYPGTLRKKDCAWTDSFSEETPLARCPDDYALQGIACFGSHCDNKQLYCCPYTKCPDDSVKEDWSIWFSEEDPGSFVFDSGFAAGLECDGKWCDNLSLRILYRTPKLTNVGECRWGPFISEEGPYYTQCPDDFFVAGMRCRGSNCDDVSLRCCKAEYWLD